MKAGLPLDFGGSCISLGSTAMTLRTVALPTSNASAVMSTEEPHVEFCIPTQSNFTPLYSVDNGLPRT